MSMWLQLWEYDHACCLEEAVLSGTRRWIWVAYARPGPHLLPSFMVCVISGIVYFSRSGLQQDNGIPSETEQFLLIPGGEVTYPSWREVPLQISIDNAFPRCDGNLAFLV